MTSVLAALVNGAILSAPVTAAVWLALRLVPRRGLNAATRYAVWWTTLAIATALPALYLPIHEGNWTGHRSSSTIAFPPLSTGLGRLARIGRSGKPAAPPAHESVFSLQGSPSSGASSSYGGSLFFVEITGRWPQWILTAWVLVTSLLLVRLVLSYLMLDRRNARACAAPAHLAARVEAWLAHCGAPRRGVRLAASAEISAPIAAGPHRPSILIPARLFEQLEEGELEQIGLHEAAHLARGDDYALILQRVIEALFPWHPVVRWITRRIDLERETACDDFVVAATGRPRSYAACLTRIVELTGGVRASMVASAATHESSHLAKRVEVLLDKDRNTRTRLLKARLAVIVVALAALAWVAETTPALLVFAMTSELAPLRHLIAVPNATGSAPQMLPKPSSPTPALSSAAQRPQTTGLPFQTPPSVVRLADTALVLIPVEVTDPRDRFVTGLDKDNFKLFEDGVEQEIAQFSSEEVALSVGIVFDISSNARSNLDPSREAVAAFFKATNREDEFFLVGFNDRPQLINGFTTNPEEIQNKLVVSRSRGKTPLSEAIYMAAGEMKKARNPRRALLVISDGVDNNTPYAKSEIENLVREADVRVYAIGISEPLASPRHTLEEHFGDDSVSVPALLSEVTEKTGGRYFAVDNAGELVDVGARIGVKLRNLYVLGYSPKNSTRDGQYRKIHVELLQPRRLPPLEATFRDGYYAPAQ
jgi:Ca-activated chloride channel family protein